MKKTSLLFILILVVVIFGLYWRTFGYPFIWDDELLFRNNPFFVEKTSLFSAIKMGYFSEQLGWNAKDQYYRPLLTVSFLLENKLWGIRNVTLRVMNLLIFIVALVFLYFLLKAQNQKGYFAEIVTLLFALTPLHIDNVVWVVGRADLFLLLWGTLSILFLDLFLKKKSPVFLGVSSFFLFLGIFSKETAILFPPLLFLYEILNRRKATLPYHLVNLLSVLSYFIVKNVLLGIKNVKFVIYRNIVEDIQAAVGTLGYYFRTIVFPVNYVRFLPIGKVMGSFFIASGIVAIVFFLFLLLRVKKDKRIAFPLALLFIFLSGHIVLIFSNVFPYQIYSRYMIMASLGLFWIAGFYLIRLKERIRLSLTFLIIILFIPSIVIHSEAYKSKTAFWNRASKSLPDDPNVLYEKARAYYQNKDFLAAEVALNRILTLNISRETAVMVSLLYADIDLLKANYDNVLRWMKSIEGFEQIKGLYSAAGIRFHINSKTAWVAASRGDAERAETLLRENIKKYSRNPMAFQELYNLYLGFQLWDKAAQFEGTMKDAFPRHFAHLDTKKARETFDAYSAEQRLGFYVLARNFKQAISEIQKIEPLSLDQRIFLAKLYYYYGQEEDGQKVIAAILETEPNNVEVLNKIGAFYLNELFRVKEAMAYFDKSLRLSSNQPQLLYLTNHLQKEYLSKLVEVWR